MVSRIKEISMEQLELKTYTKQELGIILGIPVDAHFARRIKTLLNNCGYKYTYGKTITITYQPTTAIERFQEFVLRGLELDIRFNVYGFACFLDALITDIDFTAMPWAERVKVLKEDYEVEIDERTLRRWYTKLVDKNLVSKSPESAGFWMTIIADGETHRHKVEQDDEEWKAYWTRFYELVKSGEEHPKQVVNKEFGCNFFGSKSIELNACNDFINLKELIEIIGAVIRK